MTDPDDIPIAAALEHLTGRCRGQFSWITGDHSAAWLSPDTPFRVTGAGAVVDGAVRVARFHRQGDGFQIEATPASPLWVNRQQVDRADLAHGDVIEFGEDGPLSRIRIYDDRHNPEPTVSTIISDAGSYMRASRKPLLVRLGKSAGTALWRVLFRTTVLFRAMLLLLLAAILVVQFLQWRTDETLTASVDLQTDALARTQDQALTPEDLAALRDDLRGSLEANRARLDTLEAQREAAKAVIAQAQDAVVFLQISYGLRHVATGQMLRREMGFDGRPLTDRDGRPRFTLEGDGPLAEVQVTGTGFLVAESGHLVTNRHVALPWEEDADPDSPLQPELLRFQAWFPGQDSPVPVRTIAASDDADLAILQMQTQPPGVTGLRVAQQVSSPGEAIIVMGYPTGLRSLLAQSGDAFIAALQDSGETGFWDVAARLARAGLIAPLSTRGIIGRVSAPTLVYDAETTSGGSGGPVLDMSGAVVAVNTAIIPEFGGSNLGVPAAHIRALLASLSETQ